MKILWVKAGKMLPVDTGGKMRSHRILKELARHHQIRFLSYYNGERDFPYESAIQFEFPGAQSIWTALPDSSPVDESLHYLGRLFQKLPFAVSKFTHPQVRHTIATWLQEEQFDMAICDFLAASSNFCGHFSIPIVLFQHNVETVLWQRKASMEPNPSKWLVYRLEASKMKSYETATLKRFNHVIAVSDCDKQHMLEMVPHCSISVVPTGADIKSRIPTVSSEHGPPKIVFTGSMDWQPNVDAVTFFCKEILPRVQTEFAGIVFQIVGRKPPAKVQRLASPSVEVTGKVASVETYLDNARLVVVPLRIGGGTRLKIFEAMARGKAVISTTVGAEGLNVQHGRDLILADDPVGFAESICMLLRDGALRRKYEQAAVACVGQYDWSHIAKRFEEVLHHALETSRRDLASAVQ